MKRKNFPHRKDARRRNAAMIDTTAHDGPRGAYGCACVSRDAGTCAALRYPGASGDGESCECFCHQWDEDDEDDEDALQ